MFRKIAGFGTCMHITHNAPYMPPSPHPPPPPQILHNLSGCFSFLLDIIAVPREIENNAYAKFGEAKKAHYGRCVSGVYWRRSFFHWPRLRIGKHNVRLATSRPLISS